ncbi:hypothetical protein ACFWVB_20155 [Streptomyces microflavus]|uniref:hypothetical protein n=1 Tax=Streptomyces microflavus TaxID=1919 RepID=UPI0036558B56
MALSPTQVQEVADNVLGCICQALDQAAVADPTQPGCPCRVCVVPGAVAWDSCEDPCGGTEAGGQLSVSVVRMYPSPQGTFPAEDRTVYGVRSCTLPQVTAVELLVSLLRCVPGPTDEGCPPSCEELAAASKVLHTDMVTVYNALLCCFPTTTQRRRGPVFTLGQQRTVGPQGGCVGLEQRITVGLGACQCPEEEAE